jgi:hypothetical protein
LVATRQPCRVAAVAVPPECSVDAVPILVIQVLAEREVTETEALRWWGAHELRGIAFQVTPVTCTSVMWAKAIAGAAG